MAFAQKEESELQVGRSGRKEKKQVVCHTCKQRGHHAHGCKNDLVEEANAHEEVKASSKEELEEKRFMCQMNLAPDTESDEEDDETEMLFSHFDNQVHHTTLFVNDEINNQVLDESAVIMDSGSTINLFGKGGKHAEEF